MSDDRMPRLSLDPTDIRILNAVQKHGQLSKTRLAEIVNLSPTPCWARLTRLKEAGYILGYRADIALSRLVDFTQVIVTVSLTQHRRTDFDRFEACIRQMDAVVDCVATGGGMDYVLKVVTPNLAAFQDLMETLLEEDLSVGRYMTYIVTRQVKSTQPSLMELVAGTGRFPDKD